ncbi:MAG: response regulator [Lachnospiraceae bacterium]|nr:response regulator [Lachnospiraceae bacterium]
MKLYDRAIGKYKGFRQDIILTQNHVIRVGALILLCVSLESLLSAAIRGQFLDVSTAGGLVIFGTGSLMGGVTLLLTYLLKTSTPKTAFRLECVHYVFALLVPHWATLELYIKIKSGAPLVFIGWCLAFLLPSVAVFLLPVFSLFNLFVAMLLSLLGLYSAGMRGVSTYLNVILFTFAMMWASKFWFMERFERFKREETIRQISEEALMHKELAESANRTKDVFLANMSHEIRTPINTVLGMDELILRESKEKETKRRAGHILDAGNALLALLNDILDLAKVETGKFEIVPAEYGLRLLISDLVNMTELRTKNASLSFFWEADAAIPDRLMGDVVRIRQCVMNLLTNAVKYTRAGSVGLYVTYTPEDDGSINLRFTVEDSGIGIRSEDIAKLSSPFTRFESDANQGVVGSGLGLSITNRLLDLMGSKLQVKSTYGRGSVFSFSIRQQVVDPTPIGVFDVTDIVGETYADYRELFVAPDARILVIDDAPVNLQVIRELLSPTQLTIDTAESGKEGLAAAGDNTYDMIFIDHMMSDMDGIEVLKQIRRMPAHALVPCIALTANAIVGAREMYLDAGFTDFCPKPVNGEKLEKILLRYLPEGKVKKTEHAVETDLNAPDYLKAIKELDTAIGLKACGSVKSYLSVIKVFHKSTDETRKIIASLLQKNELGDYAVKVHALKSSAATIGAMELSGLAAALENAAKCGDSGFVTALTPKLLSLLSALDDKLASIDFDSYNPGTQADDAERMPVPSDAWQSLEEAAMAMDHDMLENMLDDLKRCAISEENERRLAEIEDALFNLDYDAIIAAADTRKEKRQ